MHIKIALDDALLCTLPFIVGLLTIPSVTLLQKYKIRQKICVQRSTEFTSKPGTQDLFEIVFGPGGGR